MNLGGPELLIVLVVVLLIFGSKKVPELARSLGRAQKEFKDGLKDDQAYLPLSPSIISPTAVVLIHSGG
jgi:sec-independent protein translocase protein TatA